MLPEFRAVRASRRANVARKNPVHFTSIGGRWPAHGGRDPEVPGRSRDRDLSHRRCGSIPTLDDTSDRDTTKPPGPLGGFSTATALLAAAPGLRLASYFGG